MDNNKDTTRTTLNLCLSKEDKRFLKMYALEHDTTAAALIHDYIDELRLTEAEKKRETEAEK